MCEAVLEDLAVNVGCQRGFLKMVMSKLRPKGVGSSWGN